MKANGSAVKKDSVIYNKEVEEFEKCRSNLGSQTKTNENENTNEKIASSKKVAEKKVAEKVEIVEVRSFTECAERSDNKAKEEKVIIVDSVNNVIKESSGLNFESKEEKMYKTAKDIVIENIDIKPKTLEKVIVEKVECITVELKDEVSRKPAEEKLLESKSSIIQHAKEITNKANTETNVSNKTLIQSKNESIKAAQKPTETEKPKLNLQTQSTPVLRRREISFGGVVLKTNPGAGPPPPPPLFRPPPPPMSPPAVDLSGNLFYNQNSISSFLPRSFRQQPI